MIVPIAPATTVIRPKRKFALASGEAVARVEELRRPERERADRGGVRAVAEDALAIQRRSSASFVDVAQRCSAFAVASLRSGSAIERHEQREHDAGAAGDEERAPPAPVALDEAADEIAERGADRRREVEDRERAALLLGRRDVVDDRRRERRVARLADADDRARERAATRRRSRGRTRSSRRSRRARRRR